MASPKELEWLDLYLDGIHPTKAAEMIFPDTANHVVRGSQLKGKLKNEIDKALRERMVADAPLAYNVIKDLMNSSSQEAVKLKAAQDIIARGGFNPVAEHRDLTEKATEEELKAKLAGIISAMGPETIQALLGGDKGAQLIKDATQMAQATDKTLDYLEGKIPPGSYN